MEPYNRKMRHWCVQMQIRIHRSWAQDATLERDATDVREVRKDMVCVHDLGGGSPEILHFGSSAALRCLTQEDRIHLVVSFGPPALRNIVDRPQEGWEHFLRGLCIDHFAMELDDPKTTAPGEGGLCQRMANAYFSAWRSMCILICRSRRNCKEDVPAGLPVLCRRQSQQRCLGRVAGISASYDCL